MVEGIIYRYRCGIAWRDLPEVFAPWQTVCAWHRRIAVEGVWASALAKLTWAADAAGLVDWSLPVGSTIARAHQHATNTSRLTRGWIVYTNPRLKPPCHASAAPAADCPPRSTSLSTATGCPGRAAQNWGGAASETRPANVFAWVLQSREP
jgi:putative transposase